MDEPENRSSGADRAPRGAVRARMVEGAALLLATKGLEGTSFAEVLEATGSPRGSVYHHFPGGKPELLHAALDLSSERGRASMETTRGEPPAVVVEHFLALWRGLLDYSRLTAGCAVVAVTVAANGDDELLAHAGAIFRTWTDLLADLCAAGGVELSSARLLAVTVIAATEGVVALCRAERSMEPFEEVQTVLVSLTKSLGTK